MTIYYFVDLKLQHFIALLTELQLKWPKLLCYWPLGCYICAPLFGFRMLGCKPCEISNFGPGDNDRLLFSDSGLRLHQFSVFEPLLVCAVVQSGLHHQGLHRPHQWVLSATLFILENVTFTRRWDYPSRCSRGSINLHFGCDRRVKILRNPCQIVSGCPSVSSP